jgi:hypothetical protein|uniref:Uncharacterized protein n=1 Tax=Siphoviridae sp. ctHn727 TaxID=2825425 RepID=A0A8S5V7Z5_9CAUD|nr:MAG TPA: hypothetical protein [Siphoviridae sp. ctHn727]
MMISEFIERTGFEPTASEYVKIEESYYDFNGNKDEFCKAFVKNGGEKELCKARAAEIVKLKSQLIEMEKQHKTEMEAREKQIAELNADLDRELEWKPCDGSGTNMTQERYEHLANCGQVMSDEEAKKFIADECGFDPEKIHILHEVNTYEVNKHRRLRVAGTFDRAPMYESTDWNYIRFDCACFMYEFINGQLCFYCC